jgi:hypothetical protein
MKRKFPLGPTAAAISTLVVAGSFCERPAHGDRPLGPLSADEERIAVVVGADVGLAGEEPLRFAEADARKMRDVLLQLGSVRSDRAILVLGGGPEQVVRALIEARGRAAEIGRSGKHVILLFYYSGHGDDESMHLPQGVLPLADLREAIASVPADFKVSLLDSCRTMPRAKGTRRGPAFSIDVAPGLPRGTVEVRASSIGESAQESDELSGGVFTHFLVSALRGSADVDADGTVTLAEAYTYTYRQTLMRTGARSALQHPVLAVDLVSAGDVGLTHPAGASATLEVPAGAERYLVFALPSASVVGEVSGDSALRLAVPPGRLLVARHAGGGVGIATLDLSWGGERRLQAGDFRPVSREEFVRRGGHIDVYPRRIEPRVGLEWMPGSERTWGERVGAALATTVGSIDLELDISYVGGSVETAGFTGSERAVAGGSSVGLRTFWGPLTLTTSVGVELRYAWQQLARADSARLQAAGLPAHEDRGYGSFAPGIGLRIAVPLGDRVAGDVGVSARADVRRELDAPGDASTRLRPLVLSSLGIEYAF